LPVLLPVDVKTHGCPSFVCACHRKTGISRGLIAGSHLRRCQNTWFPLIVGMSPKNRNRPRAHCLFSCPPMSKHMVAPRLCAHVTEKQEWAGCSSRPIPVFRILFGLVAAFFLQPVLQLPNASSSSSSSPSRTRPRTAHPCTHTGSAFPRW
jgi:hypothetical protein